ncbi:MAG: CNNM domain-containing protein [Bacteroidota bacterium]
MFLLFVYLFIALFTSALCSIMEAVLLSTPVSFLRAKANKGDKSAKLFIELKRDIDRPLSAILSLNTVAHTVGAAGVGSQATIVFGDAYFGIVSAVLTLLILVFTEIIPKTIGANYSRELMGFTARIVKGMIIITYPLVFLSALLTKLLARKQKKLSTSREEISALASIGTAEGIFGEKENRIIQNLIRLKSIKISEIMTPRTVAVVADEEMMLKDFMDNEEFMHFSRIPVFNNTRDNITGFVFRSDVFEQLARDKFELKLKDLRNEVVNFSEDTTLFIAWEELIKGRQQISIVTNEYGGMDGIATLEDIIETLLGFEIVDEKDKVEDMQQYAMEKWKKKQAEKAAMRKKKS